jgi:hypothetical protein
MVRSPTQFVFALVIAAIVALGGTLRVSAADQRPINTISITNPSGSTQTNYPLQFGRPFLEAEIPHYPQVLVNGQPVPTQANVKNRFPDGSVKFAVISVLIPSISARGATTLSFQDQATANDVPLTAAQVLDGPFDFDAQIKLIEAEGSTSASARSMLKNGDYSYWAAGPIATSIVLQDNSVARKYDLGSDSLRSIHPVFVATFWPGAKLVSLRVIGMNSNSETLQDVTAGIEISLGSTNAKTVYVNPNVTMYYATVWTKSYWFGKTPEPQINVDHNVAYLAATKFVPNFDPSLKRAFTERVIAADYAGWQKRPRDLYQQGLWRRGMGATGGRADIGIEPGWMAQWLFTGDWRHRDVALGQADLAGAWSVHVFEGNPDRRFDKDQKISALGRALSIYARPTERLFAAAKKGGTIAIHRRSGRSVWQFDSAHEPDPFSVPYMLTGDWWYLFSLQMWAGSDALIEAYHNRADEAPPYVALLRVASPVIAGFSSQVRGNAWALRNRARAAFFSPDGSPEQVYFHAITNDMIAVWVGQRDIKDPILVNTPAWKYGNVKVRVHTAPLNVFAGDLDERNSTSQRSSPGVDAQWINGATETVKPWQQHYLMIVLGTLKDMGFYTEPLLTWLAKQMTQQFQQSPPNGTFDPRLVAAYEIPLRSGGRGPYFTSWMQVKDEFTPEALAQRGGQFDKLRGNFGIIAYAASAVIANEPGGAAPWNFLKAKIHDNPLAITRFYLNEPGWYILARAADDSPLSEPAFFSGEREYAPLAVSP